MSTRGLYGVRINDQDKLAYARCNADHPNLGRRVLSYVANTPLSQIKEFANRLMVVSPAEDHEYPEYPEKFILGSEGETTTDLSDFLKDPVYCNNAYILNLDSSNLEIYGGLAAKYKGPQFGRYGPDGVRLIHQIPLNIIAPNSIDYHVDTMALASQNAFLLVSLHEEMDKAKSREASNKEGKVKRFLRQIGLQF